MVSGWGHKAMAINTGRESFLGKVIKEDSEGGGTWGWPYSELAVSLEKQVIFKGEAEKKRQNQEGEGLE